MGSGNRPRWIQIRELIHPLPRFLLRRRTRIGIGDSKILRNGRLVFGIIYSHPSRWTTIRDDEGDILAGRHLSAEEDLHIGMCFVIDLFHIEVIEWVQVPPEVEEQIATVDLTEESDGSKSTQRFGGRSWILADEEEDEVDVPVTSVRPLPSIDLGPSPMPKPSDGPSVGRRATRATRETPVAATTGLPPATISGVGCAGGRFWALAESEPEGEDDGDSAGGSPVAHSPTPSSVICEAFDLGYSEDDVAAMVDGSVPVDDPARQGLGPEDKIEIVRRMVHRRTAAAAIRPWKGPIPKVIFRATAFIRMWSLLTPTEARERLVTASTRWEMVARDIFNRFGWRSCNRIDMY
ncbi:hypothetical protein VPH35_113843 [Triticum aestivum]